MIAHREEGQKERSERKDTHRVADGLGTENSHGAWRCGSSRWNYTHCSRRVERVDREKRHARWSDGGVRRGQLPRFDVVGVVWIEFRPASLEFLRASWKGARIGTQRGCTSARINGPARPRRVATIRIASTRRTTRQVDHVPHTEPLADFPQFRPRGRKVAAQQPAAVEPFFTVIHG